MTDSKVTVCIPVAPYHEKSLDTALASVEAQTVPCTAIYMKDEEEDGPGVIRNEMLRVVKTPYVIFLDADDWIEPNYIEETMKVMQLGYYVYTDWYQDDQYVHAPHRAWCEGTWHPITTLLSTALVRSVGGFDEEIDAMEDTEFYLKMSTARHCGIRLEQALFHYGPGGRRSLIAHEGGRINQLRDVFRERFLNQMGCCGDIQPLDKSNPLGEKQPGDVLAMALWGGNHPEYGRATARMYPRMSYPKVTCVARSDVEARPNHWKEQIEPALNDNRQLTGAGGLAQVMQFHGQMGQPEAAPPTPPPDAPANFSREDIKPNIQKVTQIARGRMKK